MQERSNEIKSKEITSQLSKDYTASKELSKDFSKELSSGAEAIIYLNRNKNVDKVRVKKTYRIPEIDNTLRFSRTRKEAKMLEKITKLIPAPKLLSQKEDSIEMGFIDGIQLKKILDKKPRFALLVGKNLAILHDNNIIHGDLTTSNMIFKEERLKDDELYFIDFGLSFTSSKIEDMAVDIHLFKQALESKHFKIAELAYKNFLKAYNPKNKKEILNRLKIVEQRGRYKEKN